MQLRSIRDQVVVVMGASSGIGRETARRFGQKGARVVVSARGESGLDSLAEEIRSAGGQAIAVPADTSDFEQVKQVAERAVAEFGGIDTWVQVAGVGLYARLEDTSPEEWRRVIEVNLNGQAYAAIVALPHLKRRGGGALICVSSVEARRALPFHSAYAASKHGIKAMCEALRQELLAEGSNVSVTEIMPATINTPFFDNARTKMGVEPAGAPPIYPPESVAKAILYAAQHAVRELAVGSSAKAMIAGEKASPSLMDKLLGMPMYEKQKGTRPKGTDAPDNLFATAGDSRVEGRFTDQARPGSAYTWAVTHPWHVGALAMACVGAAALLMKEEEEEHTAPHRQPSHRER